MAKMNHRSYTLGFGSATRDPMTEAQQTVKEVSKKAGITIPSKPSVNWLPRGLRQAPHPRWSMSDIGERLPLVYDGRYGSMWQNDEIVYNNAMKLAKGAGIAATQQAYLEIAGNTLRPYLESHERQARERSG